MTMTKIEPNMQPYNQMPNTSMLVQMVDKKEYDELDFMFTKHVHAFKGGSEYSNYVRTFSVFDVKNTIIYVEHNDGVTNIYTEQEFNDTFTVITGYDDEDGLPKWMTITIMSIVLLLVITSFVLIL